MDVGLDHNSGRRGRGDSRNMTALKTKLRSQRGETLVEVLASILIASLSVAMLIGGVAVSANLGRQADTTDKYFYQTLTAAEKRQTPVTDGFAQLTEGGTSIEIPVQIYGDEGLYSYARVAAGGAGP